MQQAMAGNRLDLNFPTCLAGSKIVPLCGIQLHDLATLPETLSNGFQSPVMRLNRRTEQFVANLGGCCRFNAKAENKPDTARFFRLKI